MPVRDFVVCTAALLSLPAISLADVLWDNGPIITNPTGGTSGIAGQPISQPQAVPNSSLTSSTPGISATAEFGIRVAENFTVPAGGWDLENVVLFAFQSSQSTPSVSNVKINLWTSAPFDALSPAPVPDPLPQPILATPLTIAPTSAEFVAYRQLGTSSTSSASRAIFAYTIPLNSLPNGGQLAPGEYWLEWSMEGVVVPGSQSATQVVVPLVTPRESAVALDARQYAPANINGQLTTTWFESREVRWELIGNTQTGFFDQPMALPFVLNGTVVPEPASISLLILAGATLLRRRVAR